MSYIDPFRVESKASELKKKLPDGIRPGYWPSVVIHVTNFPPNMGDFLWEEFIIIVWKKRKSLPQSAQINYTELSNEIVK